jgi:deoxyxylulose-5-phosphate synthase
MKSIIRFGVPDNFIEHGTQMEQQIECGYNKEEIIKKIHELL